MDVLKGLVSDLRVSELVSGQYCEQVVYRATFVLDGKHKVRLQGRQKPGLREGDIAAVSGTPRPFGLNALAYVNLTTGEQGNVGKWEALIGGIVFVVISMWWATGNVAFLAAAAGVWCICSYARIAIASRGLHYFTFNPARHTSDHGRAPQSDV